MEPAARRVHRSVDATLRERPPVSAWAAGDCAEEGGSCRCASGRVRFGLPAAGRWPAAWCRSLSSPGRGRRVAESGRRAGASATRPAPGPLRPGRRPRRGRPRRRRRRPLRRGSPLALARRDGRLRVLAHGWLPFRSADGVGEPPREAPTHGGGSARRGEGSSKFAPPETEPVPDPAPRSTPCAQAPPVRGEGPLRRLPRRRQLVRVRAVDDRQKLPRKSEFHGPLRARLRMPERPDARGDRARGVWFGYARIRLDAVRTESFGADAAAVAALPCARGSPRPRASAGSRAPTTGLRAGLLFAWTSPVPTFQIRFWGIRRRASTRPRVGTSARARAAAGRSEADPDAPRTDRPGGAFPAALDGATSADVPLYARASPPPRLLAAMELAAGHTPARRSGRRRSGWPPSARGPPRERRRRPAGGEDSRFRAGRARARRDGLVPGGCWAAARGRGGGGRSVRGARTPPRTRDRPLPAPGRAHATHFATRARCRHAGTAGLPGWAPGRVLRVGGPGRVPRGASAKGRSSPARGCTTLRSRRCRRSSCSSRFNASRLVNISPSAFRARILSAIGSRDAGAQGYSDREAGAQRVMDITFVFGHDTTLAPSASGADGRAPPAVDVDVPGTVLL